MNAPFKIPTQSETEPAERTFDLRSYLNFAWRHWMFIGAVTGIALIVGVIQLVRATPLYTASTQVLLEREKAPGDTSSDRYYDDGSMIENQLAILRSDSLLRRVVLKERLAATPATKDEQSASQPTSDEDAKMAEASSCKLPSMGCEVH